MSLELANTLATFGTFVVIAATAIAAIVQLRHARGSNHIAALNELRETMETPDFRAAYDFVTTGLSVKLQDPVFRHHVAARSARTDETRPFIGMVTVVGNFYEGMGVLVRTGLVEKELVLQMFSEQLTGAWERIAPVTAIFRRGSGPSIYENFEYLTVVAQDWLAERPDGTYPRDVRRIDIRDAWLDADKQYAASLVPAIS
jgi:hypothetical protein